MSCGVDIVSGVPVAGFDANAIHDNVAAEISAIAEKVAPVNADLVVIEDSAAGNAKKRVQIGNLPGGVDPNAIHDNVAAEISAIAPKAVPVDADYLLIEDSAAADAKKSITIGTLPFIGSGDAAGGDLGGTYPNPTVDDGADSTAIHDNIAAEISAIALKGTPVNADLLVIEDSAAANAKKRITVGTLPFVDVTGAIVPDSLARFDDSDTIKSSAGVIDDSSRMSGVKTYTFTEFDNGSSGAAKTIDWNNGQKQKVTLTANTTLTFTAPLGAGSFTLRLIQDGTGGRSVTWPATVKWPGTAADISDLTLNQYTVASIYYDGTNYNTQVPKDATDDAIPFT